MDCNTLIVGGGIAGLYVAEQLALRGDNVLLFEKNDYFGGRIYTFRDPEQGLRYEAGAGRIHRGHRRVSALVRRFGLRTYSFSGDTEPAYTPMFAALYDILTRLSPEALRRHTIAELVPPQHRSLLAFYPYWAETHMMRADTALESFGPRGVMMDTAPDAFYGVAGGIDTLTQRLAGSARAAGARLESGRRVFDVRRLPSGRFRATVRGDATNSTVTADRVVFAVCRCSLGEFRLLREEPFLQRLATVPLLRIYAVYPPNPATGRAWFADMGNVVTPGPLRFVIPINPRTGLIMISYTDGADTEHWRRLEGAALQRAIQAEVRRLFPDREIPTPTYVRKHYWRSGCTYWLPGDYDVDAEAARAAAPQPGVYVCGESVSAHQQAWIEGALETAESLVRRLV